jgi:hypothetical protein
MGGDSRMDSARWNGENEDDRSRTDPIEHFMEFVSELSLLSQLLMEQCDN